MKVQTWPDRLWNMVASEAGRLAEESAVRKPGDEVARAAREPLSPRALRDMNRTFSENMERESTNLRPDMLPRTLARFGEDQIVGTVARMLYVDAMDYARKDERDRHGSLENSHMLGVHREVLGPCDKGHEYREYSTICCAMGHPIWFTTAKVQPTSGTLSGYGVAVRMYECNEEGLWTSKLDGSQIMAASCRDAVARSAMLPDDLENGVSVSFDRVDTDLMYEAIGGSAQALACCMEYPSADYALLPPKAFEKEVDEFRFGGLDELAAAAAETSAVAWDPADREDAGRGDEAR